MVDRGIVTALASAGLIVLVAGCAGQRTGATPNQASPAAAVTASQVSGTWRGETWAVGTDSTSVLNRDVTLEIKDDATYRLTSTRMGTGTVSNESGVVIGERNAVVLRTSTGQSTRLQRSGDKLYGVLTSGGRAMHIIVEKAR
ncbi:MAG TPA: hypothetical protein VFA00_00875 [Actinomycetota bacterium]|jgi:hypothetical protein|nr:hypothetical protein [Actinomycetota bacterium]